MKKIENVNYFKVTIIVLCLLALLGLFLPYEKSIGTYRENLLENPESINMEEVDFTNSDVVDISIVENFKIYSYAIGNSGSSDWAYGESLINIIITIVLVVSIVLVLLFNIFNKRILTIIFSAIMGISSLAMNYDIVDRGVIPSSRYTFGVSYYLFITFAVLIILLVVGSIYFDKYKKKHLTEKEEIEKK